MSKLLSDWAALIGRHLRHVVRLRQRLINMILLPCLFMLSFGVMFSSVISVPGGGYLEFIVAGIFGQVMLTAVPGGAMGTLEDLRNGLVDRFRSLPMSGSAVLVGRAVGDTALRAIALVPMAFVGYLIGWRVHTGPFTALFAFGLLVMFGFVLSWVGAVIALISGSAQMAGSLTQFLMLPGIFLSNAYLPLGSLPVWLRSVAEWNPLSAPIGAVRELWGNPTAASSGAFPVQHPVLMTCIWAVAIMLVTAPLAIRRFRTATLS
jgi:ABC-2 type transport system permease protein